MIVVCPNCWTRFNLPDAQAKAGVRLRCSVCKHVFALSESSEPDPHLLDNNNGRAGQTSGRPSMTGKVAAGSSAMDGRLSIAMPQRKRSGSVAKWFFILLLVLLCAGGGYFLYVSPLPGFDLFGRQSAPSADLVSKIELVNVRQYPVSNEQVGNLTVIEGKVVNRFEEPREMIRLEASLYDKDNKVVATKQQLAGNAVSLFQLQVLSEQELEQTLANKLGVLTNNTNVPAGGEVPFMIVFCKPPASATEIGVKVVDARLPAVR
ncbi:MAG TPA: zinc-ribbon domain-containing protein [Candidatus Avidesulfovibrio excrementigallinarum]|nr:zinc-ribbon domain-containing protein [Candidatus Avidesulfovibrio excrementigallinarum]